MSGPRIAALVLAAGRSGRMGGPNKLLAQFDGEPLVRRSVRTTLASRAFRTIVVLGHQAEAMNQALSGCPVEIVDNPSYAEGLSTSLRRGFAEAASEADGVLILLADQPELSPTHLDRLIEAFEIEGAGSIVVACDGSEWGNPVILSTTFTSAVDVLTGDKGARSLLVANRELVRTVEIGRAASLDVDTPGAMASAGGVLPTAPHGRS